MANNYIDTRESDQGLNYVWYEYVPVLNTHSYEMFQWWVMQGIKLVRPKP